MLPLISKHQYIDILFNPDIEVCERVCYPVLGNTHLTKLVVSGRTIATCTISSKGTEYRGLISYML